MNRLVATVAVAGALLAGCSSTDGAATPDASPGLSPSKSSSASTTATAAPFTASSTDVQGLVVPQVDGGNPAAAAEFNESMQQAARDLVARNTEGTTSNNAQSNTLEIGRKVLSGLVVATWGTPELAHPTLFVATVTVNADDATPITLEALFPDLGAGLRALSAQSAELLKSTSIGDDPYPSGITPEAHNFANWLATPDGMAIYFEDGQVGAHVHGIVHVTVPWGALTDVLAPDQLPIVSS